MANIFVKKTMASMLNMSNDQVDSLLKAAEAFKSNEIDRNLAMKVFNKLSRKKPKEINDILGFIDTKF